MLSVQLHSDALIIPQHLKGMAMAMYMWNGGLLQIYGAHAWLVYLLYKQISP